MFVQPPLRSILLVALTLVFSTACSESATDNTPSDVPVVDAGPDVAQPDTTPPSCAEGTADCDGDESNGCETDLTTALDHCGGCNTPCSTAHGNAACEASICTVTCDPGWEGDDCAVDVDECTADPAPCDTNATCTNTDGSFECTCDAGYTGDGVGCTDDDECTLATDNCSDNATCKEHPGTFS